MNTGQTMLTIAALALLSIITMRYYATIGNSGQSLAMSNAGLTATTVATSFIERAQSTAFDEVSIGTAANLIIENIKTTNNMLTAPGSLGREGANENISIDSLDDFDDFNGWTETYKPAWMNESYKVSFKVFYVDTSNIEIAATKRTFLKRMDITVWRDSASVLSDTVKISTIYGYFKYNP
jgi:hypothetical protein